jgi:hypothetical protein
MEDFCDRTALELMHNAGFDVWHAHFDILGKSAEIDSDTHLISLDGISHHPHPASRNLDLDLLRRQDFFNRKYISPLSGKLIHEDTELVRELAQETKYEKWMKEDENYSPYKTLVLAMRELEDFSVILSTPHFMN